MAATKNVRFVILKHGQQGAYSDHEYVYDFYFTQGDEGRIRPWFPHRETAMAFARAACPWVDKDDPKYNWASRTLISFDRLDPTPHGNQTLGPVTEGHSDKWRIHVRSAYTD